LIINTFFYVQYKNSINTKKLQEDNGAFINMVILLVWPFSEFVAVLWFIRHKFCCSASCIMFGNLYIDCLSSHTVHQLQFLGVLAFCLIWHFTVQAIVGEYAVLETPLLLPLQNFVKEVVDRVEWCGLTSSGLGQGLLLGFYEERTESLCIVKSGKFLD